MAHALQIDTLAFTKKLREAGAEEGLAEAIVEGLTAADTSELATKGDIAEVKTEIVGLDTKIDKVATELNAKIDKVASGLDTKIDKVAFGLDAKIGEVKNDLKWMKGIGGAILVVLILPMLADLAAKLAN